MAVRNLNFLSRLNKEREAGFSLSLSLFFLNSPPDYLSLLAFRLSLFLSLAFLPLPSPLPGYLLCLSPLLLSPVSRSLPLSPSLLSLFPISHPSRRITIKTWSKKHNEWGGEMLACDNASPGCSTSFVLLLASLAIAAISRLFLNVADLFLIVKWVKVCKNYENIDVKEASSQTQPYLVLIRFLSLEGGREKTIDLKWYTILFEQIRPKTSKFEWNIHITAWSAERTWPASA